jgi:hypothetical protein
VECIGSPDSHRQIRGADPLDLRIIEDRSQGGAQPPDIFLVGSDEQIEILSGPRQPSVPCRRKYRIDRLNLLDLRRHTPSTHLAFRQGGSS